MTNPDSNRMTTASTSVFSAHAEWLKEQSATALCKIITLVNEDGYPLEDVRNFVEVHGAKAMLEGHYETWAMIDDSYDQDAIEVFVEEFGIENIGDFENAYFGSADSEEDFAEMYYTDIIGNEIPEGIVVDWAATWDANLRYDFTYAQGYVFNSNF